MILFSATMVFYALVATGELEVTVGGEFDSLWMCELETQSQRRGGYHSSQLIDCVQHGWVPSSSLPGTAAPERQPTFGRAKLVMRYTQRNGRPSAVVRVYESVLACHQGAAHFTRMIADRQGKVQRYDCSPTFKTDILLGPYETRQ